MRSLIPRTPPARRLPLSPRGYLHVSRASLQTHRSAIERRLRQEEAQAHKTSADSRILGYDDDGSGGLLIATSTEHLAHRLGWALAKTFGGEVHHGFASGHALALVWWGR
jgi:hypothetical protein